MNHIFQHLCHGSGLVVQRKVMLSFYFLLGIASM